MFFTSAFFQPVPNPDSAAVGWAASSWGWTVFSSGYRDFCESYSQLSSSPFWLVGGTGSSQRGVITAGLRTLWSSYCSFCSWLLMQGSWNEMKSYGYEYLSASVKKASHTWNFSESMPLILCLPREMRNTAAAWKQVDMIQAAIVWESDLGFWELVISAVVEMLIKYVTFNMHFTEQFINKLWIEQMYLER